MALTDPIADGLTILRNAVRSKKERADLKASKMMTEILKILRREKFIYDYRLIEDKKQGILRVYIKKASEPTRRINKISRVSRPGLRIYKGCDEIPTVVNGLGICILSTPQGLLTGDEAKKRRVGGEILARVW